jgi:hypothetical protein
MDDVDRLRVELVRQLPSHVQMEVRHRLKSVGNRSGLVRLGSDQLHARRFEPRERSRAAVIGVAR